MARCARRAGSLGDAKGFWDAKRLQQALSNLVLNALDHGTSPEPVRVRVVGSAEAVTVSVINVGVAIPSSVLRTIFEPLRRRQSDRVSPSSGTHLGLGLFVVREIVKSHGGEINVTSNEHETVFAVRLPRRRIAG